MIAWLPRWSACLVLLLPFASLVAVDPDDAEIARFVKQLGNDDFDKRQAASKELDAIGEPARVALQEAAVSSKDTEIRQSDSRLMPALNAKLQIRRFEGHTDCVIAVTLN